MLRVRKNVNSLTPAEKAALVKAITKLKASGKYDEYVAEHNEAMAHLTVPQRQQVRGALQQLGSLPEDRRRLVSRAFRDLREMPEPQRQAILTSDRLHGEFSDYERSTLGNLLAVEPYLPVQAPPPPVNAGK